MAFDTKKRAARKSLQQPGWITLEGGFAARACVVRDLSSSGAKLTIEVPNQAISPCIRSVTTARFFLVGSWWGN